MHIDGLDHLVLTVRSIGDTCNFYSRVLGFQVVKSNERWALHFGRQKINLHEHGREFNPKAGMPTPGSADLCFITANDIGELVAQLRRQAVEIEVGPVERHGALGVMTSVYCRDPDGNLLEISKYK